MDYLSQKQSKKAKGYNKFEHAALARSVKGYVSLDIAKSLCERGIQQENGLYYWRHDRRLLAPSPLQMTETQVLSCLTEIKAQTYLIWASKGFSFDSDKMKARIQAVKNIKVERLDGGHHIHMEKPEVISQLLAKFYQSIQ